jgi:H+-transporting ATPase
MKTTISKSLHARRIAKQAANTDSEGVPRSRTRFRAAIVYESLYSNCVFFTKRSARKIGFGGGISIKPGELQRFSSIQAQRTGATLSRNPKRT